MRQSFFRGVGGKLNVWGQKMEPDDRKGIKIGLIAECCGKTNWWEEHPHLGGNPMALNGLN